MLILIVLKQNNLKCCLQHNKTGDSMLLGASSRSPEVERPASPKYSERLSPSVNAYLSEASRHEIRVIVPTLSRFHPQFFFP